MTGSIEGVLRKYWGYDGFLPLQKEATECVVSGRDSIVVLPTGGGKSICYQAPAVLMPGLAVVVSPLISLMKDQVDALGECGIPAARIDSTMTSQERAGVSARVRRKELKILYLAPERLVSNSCIELLKKTDLSAITVDEAHCISMWGHDFRPDYRGLAMLRDVFNGVAIHAYTATATEQVRRDIAQQLRQEKPEVLVGSFDRANLIYKTERHAHILNQVCAVLDRHRSESGIIYRIRRADVDDMCAELGDRGYRVLPYHAGMEADDRKKNQEAFIKENVDIIVATVAFGMGIDKSNVRFVIHAGMPKSLEQYQQESGRAGRDGLEAVCCLFYSGSDHGTWKYLFREMDPQAREIALAKLDEMYNYCTGVTCRHKAILNYFGQDLDKDDCGACDVCLAELTLLEGSLETAQKILSCIKRLDERFGAGYTAAVLYGSRRQRILDFGHDKLSTHGLLSDFRRGIIRDWIGQLVAQGYIQKAGEYNVLNVTSRGSRVMRGEETPRLLKPAERRPRASRVAKSSWEGVDKGLFEALRKLRWELAAKKHVPPYIMFSDATLRDMARRRPSTPEGFLAVHGVGELKREQYGAVFLEAITIYDHPHSAKIAGISDKQAEPKAYTLEEVRQKYPRAYEKWNPTEDERLTRKHNEGISITKLAAIFQRRPSAIRSRLRKLDWLSREG